MLAEQPLAVPLTDIGEFIAEPGLWQIDRRRPPAAWPRGWEHSFIDVSPSGRRMRMDKLEHSPYNRLMHDHFIYNAADESATAALGAALAEVLPDGTTVALWARWAPARRGWSRRLPRPLGVDRRDVTQPHVRAHSGISRPADDLSHRRLSRPRRGRVRLARARTSISRATGWCWSSGPTASRSRLPRERVEIRIEVTGPESRRFEVVAIGQRYEPVIEQVEARSRCPGDPPAGGLVPFRRCS